MYISEHMSVCQNGSHFADTNENTFSSMKSFCFIFNANLTEVYPMDSFGWYVTKPQILQNGSIQTNKSSVCDWNGNHYAECQFLVYCVMHNT